MHASERAFLLSYIVRLWQIPKTHFTFGGIILYGKFSFCKAKCFKHQHIFVRRKSELIFGNRKNGCSYAAVCPAVHYLSACRRIV